MWYFGGWVAALEQIGDLADAGTSSDWYLRVGGTRKGLAALFLRHAEWAGAGFARPQAGRSANTSGTSAGKVGNLRKLAGRKCRGCSRAQAQRLVLNGFAKVEPLRQLPHLGARIWVSR